jgi:Branched-chain amino acid transport protein (AzlD)
MSGMTELHAYVLLVLVGFLPNEIWRMLGLVFGRGIDEESEVFTWARAVATAVLAGVIAKIVIFAPGALAGVPLIVRLGAIACGFVVFLLVAAIDLRRRCGRRGRAHARRTALWALTTIHLTT